MSFTITRPRFGRVPKAQKYSGLGRGKPYEIAAENPGLFRKCGDQITLVDFDLLDQILADLPAAEISKKSDDAA
jgi:hypothetical protein